MQCSFLFTIVKTNPIRLRRNTNNGEKDKKDKIAFYAVLDAFIGKKKLKDTLSNVLVM